jgi:hypothetical protein
MCHFVLLGLLGARAAASGCLRLKSFPRAGKDARAAGGAWVGAAVLFIPICDKEFSMESRIFAACLCAGVLLSATSACGQEHAAHVHGVAHLDVALEGTTLSLQLESPLDNLLGFEHAPTNKAEAEKAKRMAAKLRAADRLFALTPAAGCKPEKVTLESSALTAELLGEPEDEHEHEHAHEAHGHAGEHEHAGEEGHADLEAFWQFRCARPADLQSVEIRLFRDFSGLHTLEVQAVTPKGQRGMTLTSDKRALTW